MGLEEVVSVTSKDRVLLYLSDYARMEDRYELPAELTQESISNATAIQRKHLPQYLKDLVRDNLVVQRKAHVKGMKQRMNGYYLTRQGHALADDMKRRLGAILVPVKNGDETVDMRIDEIDAATSVHITFCDIVTEAVVRGCLEMDSLERIESGRLKEMYAADSATDSYRRALKTAWRDGKVTATERFLIEELRSLLKITEEQHRDLEEEILKALAKDHMEFLRIYRRVLEISLADGELDGPEVEILAILRKMLRISPEEHEQAMEELRMEIFGPEEDSATDE